MRNLTYLLKLPLHARHQHNTGNTHSQQQEEGIDETSHCRIISTGTASTQQAGGAAAQARDLHKQISIGINNLVITVTTGQIDRQKDRQTDRQTDREPLALYLLSVLRMWSQCEVTTLISNNSLHLLIVFLSFEAKIIQYILADSIATLANAVLCSKWTTYHTVLTLVI